ncbi:hypothetical protein TSUD_190770 [Trifolium subterraneum]|uniref:Uncharacterized protein n=1 Tax=Trifolium subterraneum TaxID=3900 RepID=A0A2Z6PAQ1_TRISU|nr:hypothetical protein TSUD_190770 [Trifolium subterraneum]
MLRDSDLNEFEVHVTKKSNKLYFDKGWSDLKNVDPKFFTIRITTRWGVEVKYPMHSPPLKRLLDRTGLDNPSSSCTLPWSDFGEHVFTFGCSDLVLVDCLGERYQCKVTIGVDVEGQYTGLTCALFMEWLREQGLDFVLPSLPVIMSCMLLLTLKWGFRQH